MIIVEDYSYEWKNDFEKIKHFLSAKVNPVYPIEHVGSTSVEGLAAKPIIDLVIIVPEKEQDLMIATLKSLGYSHRGYMGIEGRHAFKGNEKIQSEFKTHHLYVGASDCTSIQNFIYLRDFLRNNPDYIKAYGDLKKANADKYTDIDLYIEAKSSLISEMLLKSGMEQNAVKSIFNANKSSK